MNLQIMDAIKKIDDLGRIAIPKEIRRSLRLMGGDQVKIRTTKNQQIVITKYLPNFSAELTELKNEVLDWIKENGYEPDEKFEDYVLEAINRLEIMEHEYCRD